MTDDTAEVERWADAAMFRAQPHTNWRPETGVLPTVKLLWMTPDPLGAIAAMARMYEGEVTMSLSDITDDERRSYFEDACNSQFKAPLEAVKLHFIVDGVDRAFTHQHVRQRTAVFAQESMRFAVVEDLPHNTTLPPSLMGTHPGDILPIDAIDSKAEGWRAKWDRALDILGDTYTELVASGMPAEDARGLLPHCTATRIEWVTDLSNLSYHAGNRLCTQAQFHWRLVLNQVVKEIARYGHDSIAYEYEGDMAWSFELLAGSRLFRPACYQLGHCPFKASFDRSCSIRERVDDFSSAGVPSSRWDSGHQVHIDVGNGSQSFEIKPIKDSEWLMDPAAARRQPR